MIIDTAQRRSELARLEKESAALTPPAIIVTQKELDVVVAIQAEEEILTPEEEKATETPEEKAKISTGRSDDANCIRLLCVSC